MSNWRDNDQTATSPTVLDSANEETRQRGIVLSESYAKYAKRVEAVVVDDDVMTSR